MTVVKAMALSIAALLATPANAQNIINPVWRTGPDELAQPRPPRPAEGTPADKRVDDEAANSIQSVGSLAFAAADVNPSLRAARLYFTINPMGQKLGAIEALGAGRKTAIGGG